MRELGYGPLATPGVVETLGTPCAVGERLGAATALTSIRRVGILSDAQHEVMAFVAACNRNYYNPAGTQVEMWRNNRNPAGAVYKTVRRKVSEGTQPVDFSACRRRATAWSPR